MNQTYSRKTLNNILFDNFLGSNKDTKSKKSNFIYTSKKYYKQVVVPGINFPIQTNTIYKDYNNFPSLSKCQSTSKVTKTQTNQYSLSKSFISFPKEQKGSTSPQVNLSKHHRDKSASTIQSTDERKELNKYKAELKEKNDLIKSLNRAIENYIKDKAQYTKELISIKYELSDYKLENNKLKEDYTRLQASHEKLKNSIKLEHLSDLVQKEEIITDSKADDEDAYKYDDQSLSGICFTDKVKMEKTINYNENNLPTLDFAIISGSKKEFNIEALNLKIAKHKENKYNETIPKHCIKNSSNISKSNNKQRITFGKHIHKSEGNLLNNKILTKYKK